MSRYAARPADTRRTGSRSSGGDGATARGVADRLCLAASPTFAIMALITAVSGETDVLCAAMQDSSPLSGMVAMYLLMSAFHLAPWLRLVSSRRSAARRA